MTCIGKNADNVIETVWYFNGSHSIELLQNFEKTQLFNPALHMRRKSNHPFTIAYSSKEFRFDMRDDGDIKRLFDLKLNDVKNNSRFTLKYLNEDDSQIKNKNYVLEQKSFAMTRNACATIGLQIERLHDDSYSEIDFRIKDCRVQDKTVNENYHMRKYGGFPYNPDKIDILQISDIASNIVYAIPMRYINNNSVYSTFSSKDLMKEIVYCAEDWRNKYKNNKYDFKNTKDITNYVNACEAASKIPKLTDENFYKDMIDSNTEKFGSKKQLKKKSLTAA